MLMMNSIQLIAFAKSSRHLLLTTLARAQETHNHERNNNKNSRKKYVASCRRIIKKASGDSFARCVLFVQLPIKNNKKILFQYSPCSFWVWKCTDTHSTNISTYFRFGIYSVFRGIEASYDGMWLCCCCCWIPATPCVGLDKMAMLGKQKKIIIFSLFFICYIQCSRMNFIFSVVVLNICSCMLFYLFR